MYLFALGGSGRLQNRLTAEVVECVGLLAAFGDKLKGKIVL
jgi:hypothetical protein